MTRGSSWYAHARTITKSDLKQHLLFMIDSLARCLLSFPHLSLTNVYPRKVYARLMIFPVHVIKEEYTRSLAISFLLRFLVYFMIIKVIELSKSVGTSLFLFMVVVFSIMSLLLHYSKPNIFFHSIKRLDYNFTQQIYGI